MGREVGGRGGGGAAHWEGPTPLQSLERFLALERATLMVTIGL